jgi:hypothetical protein
VIVAPAAANYFWYNSSGFAVVLQVRSVLQ